MKFSTRDLASIGLFAALHVSAALLLRFGGEAVVPFSLVPLFAMLAGTMLGKKGAWSLVCYTLLGLMGVPVFAKAPFGGLTYVSQPSFGFIIGYVVAALVIGAVVDALQRRTMVGYILASLAGLIVLYACGLPYMYLILRFVVGKTFSYQQILTFGFYPFIGFDLVKAVVASAIAFAVARRLPVSLRRSA